MDDSSLSSLITIGGLTITYALITLAISTLLNSRAEYGEENQPLGNRRLKLTQQVVGMFFLFSIAITANQGIVPVVNEVLPTDWLVFIVVFVPLTIITVVLGEIVPNSVGIIHAEPLAPLLRFVINPLVFVLRPVTWFTYRTSRFLSGLFGSTDVSDSITEEELLTLIDAGQSFEEEERRMIHSVLDLDKTTATEIMVPRLDIIAVEKSTSIAEARQVFLENGHSRMPVYQDNIDDIIGLVYVKDLLEVWHNGDTVVGSIEEITRPVQFVPETMTADRLLHEFQRNKVHMVIVAEQYGGTAGLVTMENLLEEIVGDIQDEYDPDEPEDIRQVGEHQYRIDAGIVLDDLNDALDVSLDDDDVDTLGGYIFSQLERVPRPGETLETDEMDMEIMAVEGRRIREVMVTLHEPHDPNKDNTDAPPAPLPDPPDAHPSEEIA